MLPIRVIKVAQGLRGPVGPIDTTTAEALEAHTTKLTSEDGALFRLLTDSNGRFALGILNLDTNEYEAVVAVMVEGQPTLAIIPLP
jgi:hypothetical protein